MKIYKYNLEISGTTLMLPVGAKVLSLQVQNEKPCIWVMGNFKEFQKEEERKFAFAGTGHQLPEDSENPDNYKLEYIGTIQMGIFVWHLFEVIIKY